MKNTVGFKVTAEEKSELIETASNLGISVDALLRHYVTKGRRKQPKAPEEKHKATVVVPKQPEVTPKVKPKAKAKRGKAPVGFHTNKEGFFEMDH